MRSATVAAIVCALAGAGLAQVDDRSRTEAQAARAASRLEALHREADRLAGEARTLLNELRARELDRLISADELRRATEDSASAETDLAALDQEMAQVEAEIDAGLPPLRQRLVDLYKLGDARYLRLLLSTSDIRHAGQASRTVAMLAHTDRARVEARRRQLDALRTTRERLVARQAQLTALRAEAARADAAAARALQEHNALLRRIDSRRDLTAQLAGELQIAQQNLQITLQAMARGDAVTEVVLPLAPFQGDLAWPVSGTIRRQFGSRAASAPAAASGIEIAAAEGSSVQAVHGGTVAFADPFSGFGNLVIVEHDRQTFTLYGHLLEVLVSRGDRVESGQPIGSAGFSPAGQAGLYFELRIDARPVDPLQWLRDR